MIYLIEGDAPNFQQYCFEFRVPFFNYKTFIEDYGFYSLNKDQREVIKRYVTRKHTEYGGFLVTDCPLVTTIGLPYQSLIFYDPEMWYTKDTKVNFDSTKDSLILAKQLKSIYEGFNTVD